MPSINLNEFWSQVREDSRTRMDPTLWKTTIYWLLPVELDESKNNLVLMTMQNYIREIIQADSSISTNLNKSLNRIWKQVKPESDHTLTFTIKSVQESSSPADEPVQTAPPVQTAQTVQAAQPIEPQEAAPTAPAAYEQAPAVSPVTDGYEDVSAVSPTVPPMEPPYTNASQVSPMLDDDFPTDTGYVGSFEEARQKLGYDAPKSARHSMRPIKPVYEEPVVIDNNRANRRRDRVQGIPQDSLFTNDAQPQNQTRPQVQAQDTPAPKYNDSSVTAPKKTYTKQEETILAASILDPKYTFDNFITTGTNVLPKALAQEVAKSPGEHNPFYIYGQSGMGKTHLMHAIGHQILKNNPAARIMCVPAQKYIEYYLDSLNKNRDVPKDIFHNIDVLLLDDVQAFETKDGTRQDFFHTFNDLIQMNKQIILTSDVLPEDLQHTEVRLKTRFAAGLVVTIDPPSPEVLEAILLSNLDNEREKNPDLHVDNGVIRLLSQTFSRGSIRKLEGAFNQLITVAEIQNQSHNITVEYALKVLDNILPATEKPALSITYIQDFIASFFHIKKDLLVGQKRNKQYAHPRQIAMYLCRELLDESYPQISLSFGKKDHTTALHAYTKIAKDITKDEETRRLIEEITNKIRENT
ncbi:MAG: chromosomal replication initiator protein DnaA [Veillonella sp.]|uniref:chromosomal replication initiator protein DnaA n=1 Tax=Veillonella sp. TaxID=1926307 RepID=UPI0025D6CEAF|nr:chromosomal replication initiator protein DnaA [Veillonella sp.]MBS4913189.1 chromosomal replication initiator protein DnaA [Veillonella sp.]